MVVNFKYYARMFLAFGLALMSVTEVGASKTRPDDPAELPISTTQSANQKSLDSRQRVTIPTTESSEAAHDSFTQHRDKRLKLTLQASEGTSDTEESPEAFPTRSSPASKSHINWTVALPGLQDACSQIIEAHDSTQPFPSITQLIDKLAEMGIHKPEAVSDGAYKQKVNKIFKSLREAYTDPVTYMNWKVAHPDLQEACRQIMTEHDSSQPFPTAKEMVHKLAKRGIRKPEAVSDGAYIEKVNMILKPHREAYTGPVARINWKVALPDLPEACRQIIEAHDSSQPFPTGNEMIEKLAERDIHKPETVSDGTYLRKVNTILQPHRKAYTGPASQAIWNEVLPGLKEACNEIIEAHDSSQPFPTVKKMIEALAERGIQKPAAATDEAYRQRVKKILQPLRGSSSHRFARVGQRMFREPK